MALQAGRLRHRVTIQREIDSVDPNFGDRHTDHWKDVATVWAEIRSLSVREFIAAQAPQSMVTARITIRYMDGITAGMRAVHVKRGVEVIYHIEGVLPDPGSGLEYLTLAVSEGVKNG